MKFYLVALQLGHPEEKYPALITYLKGATLWARPVRNVWMIQTPKTSAEIRDGVKVRINSSLGDKVMVIALEKGDWATQNMEKAVTEWMKEELWTKD